MRNKTFAISLKSFILGVCATFCMLGVGTTSATLIDRGPDMVYDDVLNVTWTRNANLSGMTFDWTAAAAWADALVVGGIDNWRLPYASVSAGAGPTATIIDCSAATQAACRDNEMGYMYYYNLGGTFGSVGGQTGDQTATGGEMLTSITGFAYWTGTDSSSASTWIFSFVDGSQASGFKFLSTLSAWAVRDGDVAVAAIPEPEIYAMLGVGLGVIGWAGRSKKLRKRAAA